MKKTYEEIRALQVNGFYADVELPEPTRDITDIEEKYNEMDGTEPVYSDDPRHTLLEMHVDIILPEPFDDPDGLALPFVITMDKSSRIILAIRRNWYEEDKKRRKTQPFCTLSIPAGDGILWDRLNSHYRWAGKVRYVHYAAAYRRWDTI